MEALKQTGSVNAAEIGYTEEIKWGIGEVRDRAVGSGIGRQRQASSCAVSSCILGRKKWHWTASEVSAWQHPLPPRRRKVACNGTTCGQREYMNCSNGPHKGLDKEWAQ